MTLPCTGCRHLVHAPGYDVCSVFDEQTTMPVTNPHTGRQETHWSLRPSVVKMRDIHHNCGPDRRLYQPSLWRSFFLILTGRDPSVEFGSAYETRKE